MANPRSRRSPYNTPAPGMPTQPRPLNLADPQPRGPKLPALPDGYVRRQPKRPKSRAARRGARRG